MSITLTQELRDAIERQPKRPLMFEDGATRSPYVLMTAELFSRLVYDDSDLSPAEMLAAAAVSARLDGG